MKPEFFTISGESVRSILQGMHAEVMEQVSSAYVSHGKGETENPHSLFLTFKDRPKNRIIALPAHVHGKYPSTGIKWISSFPQNHDIHLPRASAVIVLNDAETGFPVVCMEGSEISAARTAASAALMAAQFFPQRRIRNLGLIGAGLINRTVWEFLQCTGWQVDNVWITDLDIDRTARLKEKLQSGPNVPAIHIASLDDCLVKSELVAFATTAATPFVPWNRDCADEGKLILHLSLRDLEVEWIRRGVNIVDDRSHVLRAKTSLDLAAQQLGHSDFIFATLPELLSGKKIERRPGAPCIFSPFGLGILDIAVAAFVFQEARQRGLTKAVDNFFG